MKFEAELTTEQIRHLQSLNREFPEPYKWYSEISPIPPLMKAVANDPRLQPIEVGKSYTTKSGTVRNVYAVVSGFVYYLIADNNNMHHVTEEYFRSALK